VLIVAKKPPPFLKKGKKFVVKDGKFVVISEGKEPEDCECCKTVKPECEADGDCPEVFVLGGQISEAAGCTLPELPQYFATREEAQAAGDAILADCPFAVLSIDNAKQYCCGGKCQPTPCCNETRTCCCMYLYIYGIFPTDDPGCDVDLSGFTWDPGNGAWNKNFCVQVPIEDASDCRNVRELQEIYESYLGKDPPCFVDGTTIDVGYCCGGKCEPFPCKKSAVLTEEDNPLP
jgi:hypothetical protein